MGRSATDLEGRGPAYDTAWDFAKSGRESRDDLIPKESINGGITVAT